MEKRPFNRSMETVTLPPWARNLHLYAEWDLTRAGLDRKDEQAPHIEIVWRPEQMGHTTRAAPENQSSTNSGQALTRESFLLVYPFADLK